MTAKEYLSQARTLNDEIRCKTERLVDLRSMSDTRKTEDVIIGIVDLEREIHTEIGRLVVLKKEIGQLIMQIPNPQYRMLLELRYLCRWSWRRIAVRMNYTEKHIYKIHKHALNEFEHLLKVDTK